jgi:hypothetical protein
MRIKDFFNNFSLKRKSRKKMRGCGKKKKKLTSKATQKATQKSTQKSTPKSTPKLKQKLTPLEEALQKKEAAWEKYRKLEGDRSSIQRQLDFLIDDVSHEHTEERSESLFQELEMINKPLDDAYEDFLDAQMEYESVAASSH